MERATARPLHSTFKIPLNVTGVDTPMCAIKRGTALVKVINDCQVIIVDEAPMTHWLAFRLWTATWGTLPVKIAQWAGIPTLFCGDFRQILPVIPRGTRANIVDASLRKSYLWQFITVMRFHTNMRVHLQEWYIEWWFCQCPSFHWWWSLSTYWTSWLHHSPNNHWNTTTITWRADPECVSVCIEINERDSKRLGERAILAPLNSMVNTINNRMVHDFPGELLN